MRRDPPPGDHPHDYIFGEGSGRTIEILKQDVAKGFPFLHAAQQQREYVKTNFYDVVKSSGGAFFRSIDNGGLIEVGEKEAVSRLLDNFYVRAHHEREKQVLLTRKLTRKQDNHPYDYIFYPRNVRFSFQPS